MWTGKIIKVNHCGSLRVKTMTLRLSQWKCLGDYLIKSFNKLQSVL